MAKHRSSAERSRWVARLRSSGLGCGAFARKHGLASASLYRWAQQVDGSCDDTVGEFTQVRVVRGVSEVPSLSVEHPSGCVVHVTGTVDEAQLGAVLRVLVSSC